jgi:mono/diheme cytochrome c family protein
MSSVDFKVAGVVAGTILLFTLIANVIPQVQSEVPLEVAFGADASPEELVSAGEILYRGAGGCMACHAETSGARGPNLSTDYQGMGPIGARCGDRVPGLACKEYLYGALVRPMEHMVEGYPPIMPPVDRTMSPPQIWALVAYLESLGGDVTVTGADIPQQEASAAVGSGDVAAVPPGGSASSDPAEIVRELCVMCHVFEGEGAPLGPPFDGIGARRSADEIRQAVLDPTSVVSEGYEEMVGVMPTYFGERLTGVQLEAVVRYLAGLR